MALLDVKERNYAKYVMANILLPYSIFGCFIWKLGSYMEGSSVVIRLAQLGASVVWYVVYKLSQFIYRRWFRPAKDPRAYGKWAVVTGATSGIGECFCHTLAARGLSVLLVSRNADKLRAVAQTVRDRHPAVQTAILVRDFSATEDPATVSAFETALADQLRALHADGGVGVLCNCVGVVNALPALLHECDAGEVRRILCVNNDATVAMTRAVLPHMMARRAGAVITVSSGSCRHPTPLVSLYSATKSFGYQLTRSLHYEYKEYGIDCLAVTPYYFISNLYQRKRATFMAPFPQSIVDTALPLLGYQAETFGWWAHALGCGFATRFTIGDPADRMLVSLKQNRERALNKKKKAP